jgi:hypothetical protein
MDDWTNIRNEWTLVNEGRSKVYQFHHSIYPGPELKAVSVRLGLGVANFLATFAGMTTEPKLNARLRWRAKSEMGDSIGARAKRNLGPFSRIAPAVWHYNRW